MIQEMMSYPFMVRAVLGGAAVSLCAALLGVSLVLRRYSMIGDGLSHVSFGALSIAIALGWSPLKVSIPLVIIAAFFLLRITENGKVKSKLGPLRYRPGFHINDVAPYVSHIGQKVNGKITYMRPDTVWAMVEYCIDHDYCEEAEANGISESGKFNYIKADLDYIPKHGFYRYKTSPVMTGEWIIAGEMKVIKILSDQEVKEICDSCGSDYLPRKETINLSEFGFAA